MQAVEKNVEDKPPRGEELSLKPRLLSHLLRDEGLLRRLASDVRLIGEDSTRLSTRQKSREIRREKKERRRNERGKEARVGCA
jgi:hypothetical protein